MPLREMVRSISRSPFLDRESVDSSIDAVQRVDLASSYGKSQAGSSRAEGIALARFSRVGL